MSFGTTGGVSRCFAYDCAEKTKNSAPEKGRSITPRYHPDFCQDKHSIAVTESAVSAYMSALPLKSEIHRKGFRRASSLDASL